MNLTTLPSRPGADPGHPSAPAETRATAFKWGAAAALAAALLCAPAGAQESVRPSLTGSAASQARQPTAPPFIYNLKAGPVIFDLRGGLELEFNDNVNLSDSNRKADLIIRPQLALNSFWQVTQLNALRLDLGISYAKYVDHASADSKALLIAPNSQLAFDVFVGDFRFNFHDRFSILQDPIENGTLSNVTDYTRFQNSAGVSVLWDLNEVKLLANYDHYNFKAISDDFQFLDRSEEQFSFSGAFLFSDAVTAGLDGGLTIIDFDEDFNNDGISYQVGPFVEAQVSNYLKLRLAAGYQAMNFESSGGNNDRSDSNNPYVVLTLAHRLSPYVTESLSAGYETRLGLTTNSVDIAFARYAATWRMNPFITLNVEGFFEDGNESSGFNAEHYQRYGVGLGFGYQLTQKLNVGTRYQFTVKDSDQPDRDYYQNRVAVSLDYNF